MIYRHHDARRYSFRETSIRRPLPRSRLGTSSMDGIPTKQGRVSPWLLKINADHSCSFKAQLAAAYFCMRVRDKGAREITLSRIVMEVIKSEDVVPYEVTGYVI